MKTKFTLLALTLTFYFALLTFNCAAQANEPGAGNCLLFDGVNDYVDCGTNTSFNFLHYGTTGSPKWTISFWYKLPAAMIDINDLKYILGTHNGDSGQNGIVISFEDRSSLGADHAIHLTISRSVGGSWVLQSRSINNIIPKDTNWHSFVMTYDHTLVSSNAKIYIDGVFKDALTKTGNPTNSGNSNKPLEIGMGAFNNYQPFNFFIDELSVYTTILTQTEIRNNMCQKLIGNEPGLVGYWRFDETAGNIYFDSSPNGNNGTGF